MASSSSIALVISTGSSLVLLLPQALVLARGCGRSPACGGSRSAAPGSSRSSRRRPSSSPPERLLLLGGREVGREEEHRQLAVRVPARRRTGRAARAARRACPARRRPRTASGRIPGRAPPSVAAAPRRTDPEKSSSPERLLDQALLVGVVERLARDLLGGHDRQVGDLPADVVERALGGRLDVALGALGGLGGDLAAPAPWPRCSCVSAVWRARWTISSDCARASFRRSRYSASILSASSRVRCGGVDRVFDRLLARSERLADAREREPCEQHHRDAEHEQRPHHQPDARLDQEAAVGGKRMMACEGIRGLRR